MIYSLLISSIFSCNPRNYGLFVTRDFRANINSLKSTAYYPNDLIDLIFSNAYSIEGLLIGSMSNSYVLSVSIKLISGQSLLEFFLNNIWLSIFPIL